MTNNPTIDGVSRELLSDLVKLASRNVKSAWSGGICGRAQALLDAPAVERQEPSSVSRFWCHEAQNIRCVRESDYDAMQSTIAQLQARIAELKDGIDKHWKVVCDQRSRIAELESGRGEPVAWRYQAHAGGLWYLSSSEHNARTFQCNGAGGEVEPLYTSPPAPVAVVLPENLLSHRDSWLCAMDRLIELEPISHEPDSDQRGFWEHERKAIHDMYACLDATAALNGPAK